MAEKILALVEESLDDDQANDVKVIPLAGKTDIAEYMVVASGRSARHVDAVTEHLLTKLKHAGVRDLQSEGIRFAAVDLVGTKLIEVNIANPGGLATLDALYGGDRAVQVASAVARTRRRR